MLTDPLADTLSNVKNNERGGSLECLTKPASKLITRVLKVFQEHGYIGDFEFIDDGRSGKLKIKLLGNINECGVIKPRYAVGKAEFEKFEKRFLPASGFGVMIVSTPLGVISHREAKEKGTGGRLLAYVY
ncbi:MAG: 30S ribosomal protein S8 [Candidatus Hydrothermarchaeaceae archaeon]